MPVNRTILYYPTVRLPRGSWLNQAILYWDQIGTIVPQRWDDQYRSRQSSSERIPLEFTDPTANVYVDGNYVRDRDLDKRYLSLEESKDLEDQGIVRTIRPELLIQGESSRLHDFEKEFLRTIFYRGKKLPKIGKMRRWRDETWILEDKVSDTVVKKLQEKHLVHPDIEIDQGLPNYIFESETADIYFTLLARYLADIDSKFTVPMTDVSKYWNLNYQPRNQQDRFLCARILFHLPVPRHDVPLNTILNFKEDNKTDLIKLHCTISSLEVTVGKEDNYSEIDGKCAEIAENIMLQIHDIDDQFKAERIGTFTDSLYSVINKSTVQEGAIIGATIGSPVSLALTGNSQNPLIIGSFTAGGIAAKMGIKIWNDLIAMKSRQSAIIRDSGFSYLFKANSERIVRQ
jgi:hypothetical protein